jgi:hypothetical protein
MPYLSTAVIIAFGGRFYFFSSCAHRTTYVQETMNQNFLLASMNFSLSRDAPNAPAAMTANSASM